MSSGLFHDPWAIPEQVLQYRRACCPMLPEANAVRVCLFCNNVKVNTRNQSFPAEHCKVILILWMITITVTCLNSDFESVYCALKNSPMEFFLIPSYEYFSGTRFCEVLIWCMMIQSTNDFWNHKAQTETTNTFKMSNQQPCHRVTRYASRGLRLHIAHNMLEWQFPLFYYILLAK